MIIWSKDDVRLFKHTSNWYELRIGKEPVATYNRMPPNIEAWVAEKLGKVVNKRVEESHEVFNEYTTALGEISRLFKIITELNGELVKKDEPVDVQPEDDEVTGHVFSGVVEGYNAET